MEAAIFLPIAIFLQSFMAEAKAAEPAQYCGYVNCYDQCTGRYQYLQGDTCDQSLDRRRGCYQAIAYCSDNTSQCSGGVRCWDYCDGRMIDFPQGNQCGMQYNSQRSCWQAKPECW